MTPLVEVTRGDLVESVHYGDVAVCDPRGALVGSCGDHARIIYWRSSAKPIQALSVVLSGAADRFRMTDRELAICCGSHHGSAAHVDTVRGLLARMGLTENALQCGTHWPSDVAELHRLIRAGEEPSPLHNNCSGKHAGMLATALALGADPGTYLNPEHPVQQSIVQNMAALGLPAPGPSFPTGVDGCGAPTHSAPLAHMATAFARLACPDDLPADLQAAAARICAAMASEPVMVAGLDTFNTDLLAASHGSLVAKGGAEGLFVLGLQRHALGVAIRLRDGSPRGHGAVVLRILDLLGAADETLADSLQPYRLQPVVNCHGAQVGEVRAADFTLNGPSRP